MISQNSMLRYHKCVFIKYLRDERRIMTVHPQRLQAQRVRTCHCSRQPCQCQPALPCGIRMGHCSPVPSTSPCMLQPQVSTHRAALLLRYCKEVKKCGNGVKLCAYCACVTFHTLLEVSEGVLRAGEVTIRQKRVTRAVHPHMAILVWKLFT